MHKHHYTKRHVRSNTWPFYCSLKHVDSHAWCLLESINQSSCEKSKTYYEDKIDVLSVKPQVSWKHDYCVIYIGGGGKIKKIYFIASFYELLPSTRCTNRSKSDSVIILNCMASPVQGIKELEVVWGLCQLG